jgi:hypothetical protein
MKRLFVAAALAAAAVPAAQAGAIPPDTAGGPLGWGSACMVVATPAPAPATCRFTGSSQSVGYGGGAAPGGSVTLSHKEKIASCVSGAWVHSTKTVIDDSAGGVPEYLGSQGGLTPGVVYTLTVTGTAGFAIAGGPGTPAAAPPAEPADTAVDKTQGHAAGTPC